MDYEDCSRRGERAGRHVVDLLKTGDTTIAMSRATGVDVITREGYHFWLEQNPAKASKWAKLALGKATKSLGGTYTGRMLIDGGSIRRPKRRRNSCRKENVTDGKVGFKIGFN